MVFQSERSANGRRVKSGLLTIKDRKIDKKGTKRKHINLLIEDKLKIIQKIDKGTNVKKLIEEFGVGSSTIYDVKKNREKLLKYYNEIGSAAEAKSRKNMRPAKCAVVESALYTWFNQTRSSTGNSIVSGEVLVEKAKKFHQLLEIAGPGHYSNGWLANFRRRYGIRQADQLSAKYKHLAGVENMTDEEIVKSLTDAKLEPNESEGKQAISNAISPENKCLEIVEFKPLITSVVEENLYSQLLNVRNGEKQLRENQLKADEMIRQLKRHLNQWKETKNELSQEKNVLRNERLKILDAIQQDRMGQSNDPNVLGSEN